MRLPDIATDFFELVSAETSHDQSPDTFLIPPGEERNSLRRGQAAKLRFLVEGVSETGDIEQGIERMWVIVSEKIEDFYIGILDSQPAYLEPSDEVYLVFGAEIPFKAEHVCDIAEPPAEYVEWQLSQKPERVWHR